MANLGKPENYVDHCTKSLDQEERNIKVVTTLYEAFNNNNNNYQSVHLLLAPYLEWWYHGPPRHQHIVKRLLTGASSPSELSFPLLPLSLVAFGSTVVAEGCEEGGGAVSWVHAWTLSADGIITHVREYYNTSVTVTRLGHVAAEDPSSPEIRSQPGGDSKCQRVWQSTLCDESSVPGLVLAL